MASSLQSAWKEYAKTGKGYETLFRSISLFVYRFPLHYKYCSEEDCAEFFLSFYHRIPHIIQHYQEKGKGLEVYLKTCLKWHMKTYLRSKLQENRVQQLAFSEWKLTAPAWVEDETMGMEVRESPHPIYKKQARKLLLLSMKAAYDLEDRTIERIAQTIGMHQEVLFHLVEIARITLLKKEERCRRLQEKRSKLYFRIYSLQDEMNLCTNVQAKENLKRRLFRLRYYFQKIQKKLAHRYLSPSHQKVAEILGIPKGSIDSTLYYLKKGY